MGTVNSLECSTNFAKYVAYYVSKENPSDCKIAMLKKRVSNGVNISQIDCNWLSQFCAEQIKLGYSENYVGKQVQFIRKAQEMAI